MVRQFAVQNQAQGLIQGIQGHLRLGRGPTRQQATQKTMQLRGRGLKTLLQQVICELVKVEDAHITL
jgi:hypothetical protein